MPEGKKPKGGKRALQRSPAGRMARMADVARLAGVTAMTVSRALRTPEKVSEETQRKIAEAVRSSGFVPNYAARSLVAQRSQIIVALFPTILNSVFSGTIEDLTSLLADQGYSLLLGQTDFDIKKEEKLLAGFVGWRPAGIVLTGSEHTVSTRAMLMNIQVPVVELWNLPKRPFDIAVGFSNFDAIYKLTCSLHEWGYRRIGLLHIGVPHNDRSADRRNGYRAAIRDLGLPRSPHLEVEVTFAIHSGREGLRVLLERDPDIDAVLCSSDTLAVGALMEALRMGKKVPDELAVAGFGDVELASELVPSLTTVRLPRSGIAKATADVLIQRIEERYSGPPLVDCGFSIVRRESA